jgi:hypothetical protein
VRTRVALVLLAVVGLSPGCSSADVPGFCGVSDNARVAVGSVDPSQFPAEAAKHVQELKDSAAGLSGAQGKLANKIVREFAAASEAKANSLAFSNLYNNFVADSNRFDHKYCNATEPPDF